MSRITIECPFRIRSSQRSDEFLTRTVPSPAKNACNRFITNICRPRVSQCTLARSAYAEGLGLVLGHEDGATTNKDRYVSMRYPSTYFSVRRASILVGILEDHGLFDCLCCKLAVICVHMTQHILVPSDRCHSTARAVCRTDVHSVTLNVLRLFHMRGMSLYCLNRFVAWQVYCQCKVCGII